MRAFLFIILCFVLGASAASAQEILDGEMSSNSASDWDSSTQADDWSVTAFVGRKLFVEERAKPDYMDVKMPDGSIKKRRLPAFNTRYEARYEILDLVKGPFEGFTIDFVAYDHYGRPSFPKFDPVILSVVSHKSEWVYSSYYPVQRTTDGDWAICGKAFVHETESDAHKQLAASYEEPIGFIEPLILADGAACNTGTRVGKFFDLQEKFRFIPRRNKALCNRKIGLRDSIVAGTGSGPFAEIEKQRHAACMERLSAATLSIDQNR